jgi:hypothetical protein
MHEDARTGCAWRAESGSGGRISGADGARLARLLARAVLEAAGRAGVAAVATNAAAEATCARTRDTHSRAETAAQQSERKSRIQETETQTGGALEAAALSLQRLERARPTQRLRYPTDGTVRKRWLHESRIVTRTNTSTQREQSSTARVAAAVDQRKKRDVRRCTGRPRASESQRGRAGRPWRRRRGRTNRQGCVASIPRQPIASSANSSAYTRSAGQQGRRLLTRRRRRTGQ